MSGSTIRLNFAELEFLLGSTPQWLRRRGDLRMNEPRSVDEVVAAGLASLAVRDLVTVDSDQMTIASDASAAAALIQDSPLWIDMVHVNGLGVSPSRIGLSEDGRTQVIVMPAGAGCFDVVGLVVAPAAEQIAALMGALLDETGPGTVLVGDRGDDDVIGIALGRQDDDRWSCSDSTTQQPPESGSRAAALAAATERLIRLVDDVSARSNA